MKLFAVGSILFMSLFGSTSMGLSIPEDSIYQLKTEWTSFEKNKEKFEKYLGKPVILAMVYLTCKMLCPTIVSDVQKIIANLHPKIRDEVQILLVSFDGKRDTPEIMKSFMKKRKLNPSQWHLLTHLSDTKVRELAATIGFKYEKMDDGEFSHSFLIVGLDREGRKRTELDGAGKDSGDFVKIMNQLAN